MNKLKQLTEHIQKEIPEIMELKFGCKVETGKNRDKAIIFYSKNNQIWINYDNSNNTNYFNLSDERNYQILGRPITLEDVLMVIPENKKNVYSLETTNTFIGSKKKNLFEFNHMHTRTGVFWIPNKDINNQPQETIDFLHNLLTK